MKTRGQINLAVANSMIMNRGGYYTPAQIVSEGLQDCMVEWNRTSNIVKKLADKFNGWRRGYEHTTYIQVCE